MITIGCLQVVQVKDKSRLQAEIDIDGKKQLLWFEVDEQYGKYLCHERSDAFVIGVLNYAMRNGHDIKCHTPMGEDLYYQITTYLIDAVYKGSKVLYQTKIVTEIDSSLLPTANAVGTGISCGIDSFNAISQQTNLNLRKHNITHLSFHNVGSHGEGERAEKMYQERKKIAENFSREYGFILVESNSNIHDVIPQNHYLTHTYTSAFAIYALQKLYSSYYYASSDTVLDFSLIDNEKYASGYYELLLFYSFSIPTLHIHSEGATLSRLEKTRQVVEYTPSYNYLNVCTATANNCSKCEKCSRTLLALDVLDKLDLYKEVFDIKYYKSHRQNYYAKMIKNIFAKKTDYIELYPYLKNKISFIAKIKGLRMYSFFLIVSYIPKRWKPFLKKIIHIIKPLKV